MQQTPQPHAAVTRLVAAELEDNTESDDDLIVLTSCVAKSADGQCVSEC